MPTTAKVSTVKFSEILNRFKQNEQFDWFCSVLSNMRKENRIHCMVSGVEFHVVLHRAYPKVFVSPEENESSCFIRGWVTHELRKEFFENGLGCNEGTVAFRNARIRLGEFMLENYGDQDLNFYNC